MLKIRRTFILYCRKKEEEMENDHPNFRRIFAMPDAAEAKHAGISVHDKFVFTDPQDDPCGHVRLLVSNRRGIRSFWEISQVRTAKNPMLNFFDLPSESREAIAKLIAYEKGCVLKFPTEAASGNSFSFKGHTNNHEVVRFLRMAKPAPAGKQKLLGKTLLLFSFPDSRDGKGVRLKVCHKGRKIEFVDSVAGKIRDVHTNLPLGNISEKTAEAVATLLAAHRFQALVYLGVSDEGISYMLERRKKGEVFPAR